MYLEHGKCLTTEENSSEIAKLWNINKLVVWLPYKMLMY
jgi:hypothetical protein